MDGPPPEERDPLAGFGLEGEDDAWIERVREAEAPRSLGRVGEYELLAEVSRGGQGVVWRARQPRTGRVIALKRLLAGSFATTSMRLRFEREVEAAAALKHPGIVTVYGMDVVDGQPVLAMEWIDGVPATDWATRPHASAEPDAIPAWEPGSARACRDPDETLELFLRICDAMQHAHARGIVHRDLKPANILVDAQGQPHVLDFGLAKRLWTSGEPGSEAAGVTALTGSADVLGTPAYAAPEQLRAGATPIDERTDVYSLGVLLFEMLTGHSPYPQTTTIAELLEAVESRRPERPSRLEPRLAREVDTVVLRAMAKEPGERYGSVEEFGADVRRLLAGRPIQALPASSWYLLKKLVQRNRVAACLTLGLGVVSVSFGAVTLTQSRRLARANGALRDTIHELTRTGEQLVEAEGRADKTIKDYMPPCLVEPASNVNFAHTADDERKQYSENIWE